VTSINPLALTLGIPLAAKAAERGLNMVGQGFQALLSSGNAANADSESGPSIVERLQTLASELRDWLSQHGVDGPFSIQIDLPPGQLESSVTVDGLDSLRVQALLAQEPDRLEPLKEIVLLSGQASQLGPLGIRNSRALITDAGSSLIY
jgi:hypothetical protein